MQCYCMFNTVLGIEVEHLFCTYLSYVKHNFEILQASAAGQINMTSNNMVTHIFIGQAS